MESLAAFSRIIPSQTNRIQKIFGMETSGGRGKEARKYEQLLARLSGGSMIAVEFLTARANQVYITRNSFVLPHPPLNLRGLCKARGTNQNTITNTRVVGKKGCPQCCGVEVSLVCGTFVILSQKKSARDVRICKESRCRGSKWRSQYSLIILSYSPSLDVLGLGSAIVNALQSAGYVVRAVVRDASIEKTQVAFPGIEVVSSDPGNLVDAFQGMDIVIEVMSNSVRPLGIKDFLDAAEATNVPVFVACGGAFALFVNEEKTLRLIDVVDGRENFLSMHEMHMAVQVQQPNPFLFSS
jgi:hypothetical protein